MDPRPVGMFDSGVGGLSVYRAFRELAPSEPVIYFADTAFFPYGPRPSAEVRKRAFAAAHRLVQARAKAIVVACNTASAAAIEDLRAMFDVPFIGMVPGLKPAAAVSQSRAVAILATPGTLDGELYARVAEEFGRGTNIINVPGHGLAEAVEEGRAGSPATAAAIRSALGPAVSQGADVVVLGCTHYHLLSDAIRGEFPLLQIVDTAEPVARRTLAVLRERGLEAPPGSEGTLDLIVTGDRARFRDVMQALGFEPSGVAA
jgi:glutamate racemase